MVVTNFERPRYIAGNGRAHPPIWKEDREEDREVIRRQVFPAVREEAAVLLKDRRLGDDGGLDRTRIAVLRAGHLVDHDVVRQTEA